MRNYHVVDLRHFHVFLLRHFSPISALSSSSASTLDSSSSSLPFVPLLVNVERLEFILEAETWTDHYQSTSWLEINHQLTGKTRRRYPRRPRPGRPHSLASFSYLKTMVTYIFRPTTTLSIKIYPYLSSIQRPRSLLRRRLLLRRRSSQRFLSCPAFENLEGKNVFLFIDHLFSKNFLTFSHVLPVHDSRPFGHSVHHRGDVFLQPKLTSSISRNTSCCALHFFFHLFVSLGMSSVIGVAPWEWGQSFNTIILENKK